MKARILGMMGAMVSFLILHTSPAVAQGTAFSYQGQLQNNGAPANGTYSLVFSLYSTNSGGVAVAGPVTNNGVVVSNGLFTVFIDFGAGVWCGQTNWLQIGVATNGTVSFTQLNPRQRITPVPVAITAEELCGIVSADGLSGTYVNQVTLNNVNNHFSGSFSGTYTGNGAGLTNLNATALNGLGAGSFWQLTGNTVGNGNFLGSVNNASVEIHVNGQRAMLFEPNTGGAPNVIGGSVLNSAGAGIGGATIGGGGGILGNSINADLGTVGGGAGNTVSGVGSFIGGGGYDGTTVAGNQALASAATLGGGLDNQIQIDAHYGFIGGGQMNINDGNAAVIGGGLNNGIQFGANDSTIAGGENNLVDANSASAIYYNGEGPFQGAWATVSGGWSNLIQSAGSSIGGGFYNVIDLNSKSFVFFPSGQNNFGGWSVIAGGAQNTNSSTASFIGGGGFNDIQSPAYWSVVCGGEGNIIDSNSYISTLGFYGVEDLNNLNGGFSVIVGGAANKIRSDTSFLGGGVGNLIDLGSSVSFIGGGNLNRITNSSYSFIGGGSGNFVSPESGGSGATIGGGNGNKIFSGGGFIGGGGANTVDTNGTSATISGGSNNRANGLNATVPGGFQNLASGQDSFAAGKFALATNDFSFVWGGNSVNDGSAHSTGPSQFLIFSSEVGINTSTPTNATLAVNGTIESSGNITSDNYLIGANLNVGFNGNFGQDIFVDGSVHCQNNGIFFGDISAANFSGSSDRNIKDHFKPVNPVEVLDRVASLPITRWNFKADENQQHIGPMAQDFYAAFDVGPDDRHITTVDEGGVALAAIQGLNEKLNEKDAEIADLKSRLEALEQIVLKQKPGNKSVP